MSKDKKDYCLDEICSMKETAASWMKAEMGKGVNECSLQELSEVADIIKDLAEAEKYMKESEYFCLVNDAMEDASEEEHRMMGYNSRHMANGRFAPSGQGHIVRGYDDPNRGQFQPVGPKWESPASMYGYDVHNRIPYDMMYLDDPEGFKETMRKYGYHDGMMDNGMRPSKYGTVYDNYQMAKRYYHEGDTSQKDKMKAYANEHMSNLMMTAGEMFQDADPEMQKKMMKSVEGLLAQWKTTHP